MKSFSSLRRRGLAAIAGAVIGLTGALALSSPASAHHSEVSGSAYCDTTTGNWIVDWTVKTYAPRGVKNYRLTYVKSEPTPVEGISVTEGRRNYPHKVSEPLTGRQIIPGNTRARQATLTVQAQWDNGFQEFQKRTGKVKLGGKCKQHVPPTEPAPEPDPDPASAYSTSTCEALEVFVENPETGRPVTAVVVTNTEEGQQLELEPGTSGSVSFPASEGLTYQVIVDDQIIDEGAWENPGDCETEIEVPVAAAATCDSLIIEITNPLADQQLSATVTVGDTTEELTVEPGETAEVSFPAQEGTVATVSVEGGEPLEIAWEAPEECDEEPAEPAPSDEADEPTLPVTGSKTPLVIGAAVLLLAVGGGLFWFARRRRITFTA